MARELRLSAVLLVLLTSCLGGQAKLPIGSACDSESSCDDELVCLYGRCRELCTFDRDCSDGYICVTDPEGRSLCVGPEEANPEGCADDCDGLCIEGVCMVPVGDGDADADGDGDVDGDDDADVGDVELDADADADGDAQPVLDGPRIAAGGYHTCAVVDEGGVRCWGRGLSGQLGTGDINAVYVPLDCEPIDFGPSVRQIVAGGTHTCALLESGDVQCWGWNSYGELGYDNTDPIGDDELASSIGPVQLGENATQVITGRDHTCAILVSGDLLCWGSNVFGQLGYGNTENIGDNELPVEAGNVQLDEPVVEVAGGEAHTCAVLESGSLRCWGNGLYGRLGYGDTNIIGDDELPTEVGPVYVESVRHIALGGRHTCALLDGDDGELKCWGRNVSGQLGYGNVNDIGDEPDELPSNLGPVPVGGLVTRVTANMDHTCAVIEGGNLRCWGLGQFGRLGYGNENDLGDDEVPSTFDLVQVGGDAVETVAGLEHTCALLTRGDLLCWGNGLYGRLGYGNRNNVGDDETPATVGPVSYQ